MQPEVARMDPENARFPLCITWTPLPMITWFLPMIGHTGICGTDGIIYDFAGPYYISKDDFAFGETHKYVLLDIDSSQLSKFDQDIQKGNSTYRKRMHNICCDNCHSHVARVLNNHRYMGKENWTMISVWWLLITDGKYVSVGHIIWTYIGFIILLAITLTFKFAL